MSSQLTALDSIQNRSVRRVLLTLAILLGFLCPVGLHAQEEEETGTAGQLWANFTLGREHNEKLYLELDFEPKIQVSDGEDWGNLDTTPLLEYYPNGWIDLTGETTLGITRQRDGVNTLELTPRVGIRFHFFEQVARPHLERLPLRRLGIATLFRIEWRNFYYSDDQPNYHAFRGRLRLESKLALNHDELATDGTLYAIGDAEYYAPFGDDIPERYVNKIRVRLGLGYRFSEARRFELLYIRDWNRDTDEVDSLDSQALDLRFKFFF